MKGDFEEDDYFIGSSEEIYFEKKSFLLISDFPSGYDSKQKKSQIIFLQ